MGLVPKGLLLPLGLSRTESWRNEYGVSPKLLQLQTAGLQTFRDMRKNLGFESQKSWGSDRSTLAELADLQIVMKY